MLLSVQLTFVVPGLRVHSLFKIAHRCGMVSAAAESFLHFVEQSLAMCTVLAPVIGYEKAATIAKEAYRSGRTVREVARETSGIPEARLNELLDPRSQTGTT